MKPIVHAAIFVVHDTPYFMVSVNRWSTVKPTLKTAFIKDHLLITTSLHPPMAILSMLLNLYIKTTCI